MTVLVVVIGLVFNVDLYALFVGTVLPTALISVSIFVRVMHRLGIIDRPNASDFTRLLGLMAGIDDGIVGAVKLVWNIRQLNRWD